MHANKKNGAPAFFEARRRPTISRCKGGKKSGLGGKKADRPRNQLLDDPSSYPGNYIANRRAFLSRNVTVTTAQPISKCEVKLA